MAAKSVGIDIGQYSIKVVEILTTNKGIFLQNFHEQVLGSNPSLDYELEVLDFLQHLVQKYDAHQTKFCVGLRQDRLSVHFKTFPFTEKQKINKSLPFELEEDLPFSTDAAIMEAKVCKTKGNQAEVLASAVPTNYVQSFLKQFFDVGIEPTILSTEGFALCNMVEKWNDAPNSAQRADSIDSDIHPRYISLVANIGHTHTIVTFFEGTTPIGIRTILWGSKNIVEAIAKKYEIPYVEALKELQNKAFILTSKQGASWDQITFSDTISKSVSQLVKELRLILIEFKSQFNASFESMRITGGGSQILNLGPHLTQQFEMPVNKISVLDQFPNVQFDKSSKVDAVCSIALGLAIEGLKKPRNPAVNFLKGDFAKQNFAVKNFFTTWATTLQLAAALFVLFFVFSYFRESSAINLADSSQEALKKVAKSAAGLTGKNASENNIKKHIKEQAKKARELKNISNVAQMNSAIDVVKKVNDALPSRKDIGFEVKKMIVKESQVTLEGYVANAGLIAQIQNGLKSVAENGKISTSPSTLAAGAMPTFALSFNVDRNVQKINEKKSDKAVE